MASKIEWTDETWNPVTGCTKVSEGCRNCYAERMAKRLRAMLQPRYINGFEVMCHHKALEEPLHWRKPRRIFVCSMGDLFHDDVPDEFIDQVFAVMALCEQHTFMVLTKRLERAAKYITLRALWSNATSCPKSAHAMGGVVRTDCTSIGVAAQGETCSVITGYDLPLPNLWLGTSVEDQPTANERIPHLLKCPAALWFLSVEPMLARIELMEACGTGHPADIGFVICGAESGPKRRPCKFNWVRDLRDQCVASGIPFFLKQMEMDGKIVKMPVLDGRVWDQMPGSVKSKGKP